MKYNRIPCQFCSGLINGLWGCSPAAVISDASQKGATGKHPPEKRRGLPPAGLQQIRTRSVPRPKGPAGFPEALGSKTRTATLFGARKLIRLSGHPSPDTVHPACGAMPR